MFRSGRSFQIKGKKLWNHLKDSYMILYDSHKDSRVEEKRLKLFANDSQRFSDSDSSVDVFEN